MAKWLIDGRRKGMVCALTSGGLDSALLVWRLVQRAQRVLPLYVRCGLVWEEAELYWLRRFLVAVRSPQLAPLSVVEMPLRSLYGSHWSLTGQHVPGAASADAAVYLPGRNVLLLSAAAISSVQRRCTSIAIGTLRGNPFGDATPRFFKQLANCLTHALNTSIHILTPLRQLRKPALIHAAVGAPLQFTFSCLHPLRRYQHCGRCNKCAERQRAFSRARLADPTVYVRPAIAPRPSAVSGTVKQERSDGRDVAPIGAGVQVPRAQPVGLH